VYWPLLRMWATLKAAKGMPTSVRARCIIETTISLARLSGIPWFRRCISRCAHMVAAMLARIPDPIPSHRMK